MEPQKLPEELVNEILLRMPVKSLARFKCISKSWLSRISNPHFEKSHFNLALASAQKLFLFLNSPLEMVSIDFNAPSLYDDSASSIVNLNFSLPEFPFYPVRIVGSCRGFLLLECPPNLLIWNPCTGVHRQLPSPPIDSYRYSLLFGLGYDPSNDDYLVILLTREQNEEEDDEGEDHNDVIPVQIFSSRANTWREFEGSHLCYTNASVSYTFDLGLEFNQAIHWLAHHDDRSVNIIVVFDLVERVFSEIALPNDCDCNINYCQLRVLDGCLSICVACDDDIAGGIWVMEEYKMQSSWTKSHIIMPPSNILTRKFSPICFTKNGDIVGLDISTKLVKFNNKGDVLEHRRYFDHQVDCNYDLFAVMLTESLFSIPFDS